MDKLLGLSMLQLPDIEMCIWVAIANSLMRQEPENEKCRRVPGSADRNGQIVLELIVQVEGCQNLSINSVSLSADAIWPAVCYQQFLSLFHITNIVYWIFSVRFYQSYNTLYCIRGPQNLSKRYFSFSNISDHLIHLNSSSAVTCMLLLDHYFFSPQNFLIRSIYNQCVSFTVFIVPSIQCIPLHCVYTTHVSSLNNAPMKCLIGCDTVPSPSVSSGSKTVDWDPTPLPLTFTQ